MSYKKYLKPLIIIRALILLDLTHNHRENYMLKIANKFGITGPLADPLDIA